MLHAVTWLIINAKNRLLPEYPDTDGFESIFYAQIRLLSPVSKPILIPILFFILFAGYIYLIKLRALKA